VGASPEEKIYYEKVRALGEAHGAQIEANTPWQQLQNAYERAKIFWHAAGYGAEESHPQEVEHFGIVTLEAMAAGCVPIVINKGGQPEIVQHGINGFVWNTLDELKQYTLLLAQDETMWQQMSQAARQRAVAFGPQAFRRRLFEVLKLPAA
jgi:glycosyltransferase involved in cell wall biosynthesis